MATPTPTSGSKSSAKPTIVDKDDPKAADPTLVESSEPGTTSYKFDPAVQHTADGAGTQQRELKPEDYPPSLRMAPPAEQINPNAKATVGTPVPGLIADSADAAVAEGIEAHNELVRKAQAEVDEGNKRATAEAVGDAA